MARKIYLSCLLVIACILMHETMAQQTGDNLACTDPILPGIITDVCTTVSTHYGYNSQLHLCLPFQYTGCTIENIVSENDFNTIEDCENTCITTSDTPNTNAPNK
ncbi:hypothetical protein DMN91_001481 [Ooceraea biroi]|uniref:BPTI/Kunitz inhibitor domain-containing protein n=1 Tax=Ooceraea biroi TaxID=2015173 RepID=A0A026WI86_OOCBI|nr:kunitz-type serine protease inhibitor 6 [Ooceraea biroi]EZA55381.1 hypothetical protein X777_04341 [Ooceraea biroi]RLU25325.1 hypothetical protein DMN91_001481 [Ooceraea biroi]